MMTSVIRVKRRIDEDPAEALIVSGTLVSCKRKKQAEPQNVESIFSFAGTISSKNEPFSQQIKEAIKKTQLYPHTANFKHPSRKTEFTLELRKKKEQASRANRFRITCSRRALDLDLLDGEEVVSNSHEERDKDIHCNKRKKCRSIDSTQSENSNSTQSESSSSTTKEKNRKTETVFFKSSENFKISSTSEKSTSNTKNTICQNDELNSASGEKLTLQETKVLCILDVENDNEDVVKETSDQSLSGITLNKIPLISNRVMSPPENEREFVYDLYYAHNSLSDLDLEAVLTVEALCDDIINEDCEELHERDGCRDDSDDSNDENNWRNDYPDEDPNFFENEDVDDYYAEDMVDTNFLHCDDGDQLAYWMGTRCKVDGNSDEDENEYEEDNEDHHSSNNEY